MLTREKYLSKIRGFYHTESLIKIIYGMRRSGKSVILNQIMEELIKTGIKKENIIYINFESLKYDFIPVFTRVGLNVSYSLLPFKNFPTFEKTVFQMLGITVSSAASIS